MFRYSSPTPAKAVIPAFSHWCWVRKVPESPQLTN